MTDNQASARTEQITILVVEDEAAIRKLIATFLGMEGYMIREAATAAEAVDSARESPPDLIIVDLTLPDRPGADLAAQLLEAHPSLKVVLISGYDAPEAADFLERNPHAKFFKKPFQLPHLLAAVKALLAPA